MQNEKDINLSQRARRKWKTLDKHERAGICVLLVIVLGVVIFVLGTEIGKAFYLAFGR